MSETQWAVMSLVATVAFVVAASVVIELQNEWSSLPEPMRSWLLARTHPFQRRYMRVMSPDRRRAWLIRHVAGALQQGGRRALHGVAIIQNDRNVVLPVADDVAAWQAKIEAVAALIHAGLVPQTKAIKVVFGLKPSGTNPEYQRTVAAIKARVEQLRASERAVVLQPDGTTAPLSYPVTRREAPARRRAGQSPRAA